MRRFSRTATSGSARPPAWPCRALIRSNSRKRPIHRGARKMSEQRFSSAVLLPSPLADRSTGGGGPDETDELDEPNTNFEKTHGNRPNIVSRSSWGRLPACRSPPLRSVPCIHREPSSASQQSFSVCCSQLPRGSAQQKSDTKLKEPSAAQENCQSHRRRTRL